MSGVRTKAFRTLYFYLITAGPPALAGYLAVGNARQAVLGYAAAVSLAFPVSLLPGRAGGRRSVPVRVPVAALLGLALAALGTLYALRIGQFFLRGTFWGLLCGVLFFFAVREAAAEAPLWTGMHGGAIGVVLYAASGALLGFLDAPALKTCAWALALAFLAVTAFSMNRQSMLSGLAARTGARPPRSLVGGNRLLTALFAALAALALFFGQLREASVRAAKWLVRAVLHILYWIASLRGGDAPMGEASGDGMGEMLSGLGEAEPSAFWLAAEKVMIALAVVIGVALAVFALYRLIRLIARLARRVAAYMRRFAEEAGGDYTDEQEDLFDFDDLRQSVRERLGGVVRRFARRPQKWEEMTVRERVRFCVRALYRRSGGSVSGLAAMTVREAAPRLVRGGADAGAVASLYERARYSDEEIGANEAEELKKAVRP